MAHIVRTQTIRDRRVSYQSPTDLQTALEIAALDGRRIVAGGTDLYPTMQRGQTPEHFLDITRIEVLSDISISKQGYRFGAAMRWSDVARADLPHSFRSLQEAAREVGSIQIQNAGTIAGNLCNASPAADGVPPLLTLDASVELSKAGCPARLIPLREFITGVRQTQLQPGEILTAVLVPNPPEGAVSSFEKLGSRKYMVISIAMVSALVSLDADGKIAELRMAVGSCSAVAQRLPALETECLGKRPDDIRITADHLSPLTPIDDIRGRADYRRTAVAEICARAIRRAAT